MMRSILIIEDNAIERRLLAQLLGKEYEIIEASNGEDALSTLDRRYKEISAIILDILMPGMDGYSVLRQIRANALYQQTPVIIATSLTDDESYERALEYGANGFVSKPYRQPILLHLLRNTIKLHETATLVEELQRDSLTGLLNRESFLKEAEREIKRHAPGYYALSYVNIDNFKVINDQYGTNKGDEVLKHVAKSIEAGSAGLKGLACRIMADKFAVLYPASFKETIENSRNHLDAMSPECIDRKLSIRIGRFIVADTSLPVDAMLDRASLAESSIRGRYDIYIAEYDDSLRAGLLHEQRIVNDMNSALEKGEFEAWFQPQYNHSTGAMIGAEALARWRKTNY